MRRTSARSKGLPRVWATMMARVFGVMAASMAAGLNVVGGDIHIDKDGDKAVLHRRIDRGGKTGGHRDDFIAGAQRLVAKLGRGKSGNREQVGRRAGVRGDGPADVEEVGELALEIGIEAPGGKPEIKRGIDRIAELPRRQKPCRTEGSTDSPGTKGRGA